MDYNLRLKIGLLITAIITPLLISKLLPPIVVAVIFILVGVSFTYFFSIDYVREQKIKEMAVIIKGLESISKIKDKREVLQVLALWGKKLVKCEEYYVAFKDEAIEPRWAELIKANQDIKEPILIKDNAIIHNEVTAILFIPFIVNEEIIAYIILADKRENYLKPYHLKLVEPLINMAINTIEAIELKANENEWELSLFHTLMRTREAYSPHTIGHGERVAKISVLIGKRLGLNANELRDLEYGAYLHDIGQTAILYNNLNLEDDKKLDYTAHPLLGDELIPANEEYTEVRNAILYHHEHYDGTGYPEGLSYTDIPLIARIVAVADTYDALTYLPAEEERLSHGEAINIIKRNIGSKFDPLVVVALEEVEGEGEVSLLS